MPEQKPMHFTLKVPIYPARIFFSISQNNEEFKRSVKKFYNGNYEWQSASGLGRTTQVKNGNIVIELKEYPSCPKSQGTLAHEIFHAVHFIADYAGLRLTMDSDESYAYLLDWITTEVYKRIS